jgi:hypothetical protein
MEPQQPRLYARINRSQSPLPWQLGIEWPELTPDMERCGEKDWAYPKHVGWFISRPKPVDRTFKQQICFEMELIKVGALW